ncbi:Xanthine/uracil permease [Eremomyces bilateralis CBS 781.70]|uniref:Xanthine/uracil permease n=1 Tax=Eremomyces bilateralis CBS 781.70 TaxID=1392243 RepID=A0A6G1G5K7_9PEZI|nr:Xanthine/uracil permease [Eremomyces bilateralis CBS 781.70]KAF1813170.1 Xanthine/uracil permease [Eremomyces bilateralis CBS 781.70]
MDEPGPDQIGPSMTREEKWTGKLRHVRKAFTTKEGLVGSYDYAFLFTPNIPFLKRARRAAPFFGLNDKMPVFLALLLGFQHALAMLAGVITPPIILSGTGAANLSLDVSQYLVSTSLIVCGLLSSIQITRFHIYKSPYYIGTGLISVVGTSFATIPVAQGALQQMYDIGYCPKGANGTKLPCPDGYGAILGTACFCALLEVAMSFTSPRMLKKLFPPIVTGPTVCLIGVKLIDPSTGLFRLCPNINAPRPLPWGSAEFIGLGFSVFVTIILCERFGSPIMKSTSVVIGLLVGCIIAATGYFDRSGIDRAPAVSFIWVHTFKLSFYGPIVLPLLAVYIVLAMEVIGDVTATCDVSRLEVAGPLFDSRIQGGVLADGLNGILAGLCTITPMSTFAQNNGVIALTRCANRKAGYACCFWLVVMGIFSKFAAALVAIPPAVLGGMTTFLFSAVAVSGIRIVSTVPLDRRNRFILTCAFAVGFGATLVPEWFDYVFTYDGENRALMGFYNAIELLMETGFALAAFLSLVLNLVLPEEIEDDAELPEDEGDKVADARCRNEAGEFQEERSAFQRNPDGSARGLYIFC